MSKSLLFIVLGVLLGAGAYLLFISTHAPGSLNADLYPLYPGVAWGPVKAASVNGAVGYQVLSQPLDNLTDIAASSTPFEAYYQSKLTQAGWVVDASREAGGPGSEVSVYTKANEFIIVSYTTIFLNVSANAPEQCPCSLQMSLISGEAQ